MHPKSPMSLEQIRDACAHILDVTSNRTLTDYQDDWIMRSAIERQFELIAEAMHGIKRNDLDTAAHVSGYQEVQDFRNGLTYRYDEDMSVQMWDFIQHSLPKVKNEVDALLLEERL
jgi:uncharacterized protein with HEPN domain